MKTSVILLSLLLLCPALSAAVKKDTLNLHNRSHRVSLLSPETIASFESGTEGFTAGNAVEHVDTVSAQRAGVHRHEGQKILLVRGKVAEGNVWRTVRRTFPVGTDWRKSPFMEMGVLVPASPVRDALVTLVVGGKGSQTFTARAAILPSLWRVVTFDLTECNFLGDIRYMEISVSAPTDQIWQDGGQFMLDGICIGTPLDGEFATSLSTAAFTCRGGSIGYGRDALLFHRSHTDAVLTTHVLGGSLHDLYSPPAAERNTLRLVIGNGTRADSMRVTVFTRSGNKDRTYAKIFPLSVIPRRRNYLFNFSDLHPEGSYTGFSLMPIGGGKGTMEIDRFTFEREEPVMDYAGRVETCTADNDNIHIRLWLRPELASRFDSVAIYTVPLNLKGDYSKGRRVYTAPLSRGRVVIDHFPLHRTDRPDMTHLSSRFIAVAVRGKDEMVVDRPFFISNWQRFTANPYDFVVAPEDFNVMTYGARGDGFTNDTHAIQQAINAAADKGGGRVIVPGTDDPNGRRYVVTNVRLRGGVELHLEKGAVLWQSGDERDYSYAPLYGHDMVIPNIPWTHSHFANMPILWAMGEKRVKISGPGTLRMCDTYTVDPDIDHYARICEDRIHIVPLAFSDCSQVVIQNLDVIRTNCYHTSFDCDSAVFAGNVKLYDAACVSADGFGLSGGTNHVLISRCFYAANDDGVTLSSSYRDPRIAVSPWRTYHDTASHGARCVTVEHSTIDSSVGGGGKAIAFITWGSTNPDPEKQIIDSILVTDCSLRGGYSVGTWPDNPFDGKPFTNGETDDFSTVQDVMIAHNDYLSPVSLLCVTPANFLGDSGIHSTPVILNGDFHDGRCYWSRRGGADITRGGAHVRPGGSVYQGLYLKGGAHSFTLMVRGHGTACVTSADDGHAVVQKPFSTADGREETLQLRFSLAGEGNYNIGISGGDATLLKAENN